MKGSDEVKEKLENWFGIKIGQTTKDGKVTLKYSDYLGWCMNNAPAVMLKRKGQNNIIPIEGTKDIQNLNEFYLNIQNNSNLPNKSIKYSLYSRFGDENPSYFKKVDQNQLLHNVQLLSDEQIFAIISQYQLICASNKKPLEDCLKNSNKIKNLQVNLNENSQCNFTKWGLISEQSSRYNLILGMLIYAKIAKCERIKICLKYEYRNVQKLFQEDIAQIKSKYEQFKNIQDEIMLDAGIKEKQSDLIIKEEPDNLVKIALILEQKKEQIQNNNKIVKISELNMMCISGNVKKSHIIECPRSASLDFILTENELSGAYFASFNEPWNEIKDFNNFDFKIQPSFSSVILYPQDLSLETIYQYKFDMLLENSCSEKINCKFGGNLIKDLLLKHKETKISLENYKEIMFSIQKYLEINCTQCKIGQGLSNLSKLLEKEIKQIDIKKVLSEGCPASKAKNEEEKKSACDSCPMKSSCGSSNSSKEGKSTNKKGELCQNLQQIKHKILVLSGKGGVGKSTVSTQLAFQLASKGFKVGLLDIDIAGPSIPTLLGLQGQRVKLNEESIEPVKMDDNLSVMSIGFLLSHQDDAIIWRGPKKSGLINQFLSQVEWGIDGQLDFLIIDSSFFQLLLIISAPPGTSDEHISLAQMLQIDQRDGAIIVTTPQEVALADVRKGIQFCRKSEIPILGVVENMSKFVCPKCSHEIKIFPSTYGGAELMSVQFGVELLGQIPLKTEISHKLDKGQIIDQNQSQEFVEIIHKQFFPILKEEKKKKPTSFEHFY